jgi:hypothetical protein
MKNIRVFCLTLAFFMLCVFFFDSKVKASSNNNIFGMHLVEINYEDLEAIAELVNSSGGDWGYVTLVIQETDRDKGKWQSVFNKLKELHLIPIIRIATSAEGSHWRRPEPHEAAEWVSFLDQLRWPTDKRYVVLFNEPNHGSEWGGVVDPNHYGRVAKEFAKQLENKDSRFFVMIGGLDNLAPPDYPAHEDELTFLNRMFSDFPVSEFNQYISGWASHSYPHPDYSGSPTGAGRGSVRSYEWELDYLAKKGVKSLPVFITETGWKHKEPYSNSSYKDESTVANYYKTAFQKIWFKDSRIQAVTPFTFNYPVSPFDQFSWKKPDSNYYYSQYYVLKQLPKIAGDPNNQLRSNRKRHLYRFWSDKNQGHFYTLSSEERNLVISSYSDSVWRYEGVGFYAYASDDSSTVPVYRFWSDKYQGHFYTISDSEKEHVINNYDDNVWKYEGVGFYVYPVGSKLGSKVYRFWSDKNGHHFYTASHQEKDYIIKAYDDSVWRYEGIAWVVPN